MMSVMLSAAGSLRWFRDTLAPGVEFGDLVDAAAEVPAGSDGLLFLPYLSGERSPHPDPLARGAFVGLTLGHDRRHMTRAVLEGVAFGLRDGLDLMTAAGMPAPDQIRASGRRDGERAVAPDPGRRPRRRDRDRRHDRGCGLRGRAAGRRRRGLVSDRRRPSSPKSCMPARWPLPDRPRRPQRRRTRPIASCIRPSPRRSTG